MENEEISNPLLVCGAILATTIVSLYLASPFVHPSGGGSSYRCYQGLLGIKIISRWRNKDNLNINPLSVLQRQTNFKQPTFIDVNPDGAYGYAICDWTLITLRSLVSIGVPEILQMRVGLTGTANGIESGGHVFTVLCLGYSRYVQGSNSFHSQGESIIVK